MIDTYKRHKGKLWTRPRFNKYDVLTAGIPLVIYGLVTLPLGSWLIDDAGISFAYARSLAQGAGLVSQPGMPPVEGFSNFLWVVLLAPFFAIKLFHPYLTPKILSFLLIGVAYFNFHRCISTLTDGNRWPPFLALLLLSFNTSFVIWTCSGLENALYVALVSLLLYLQFKMLSRDGQYLALSAAAGFVVSLGAMTRPDGIVFGIVFPAALMFRVISKGTHEIKPALAGLAAYLASFILLFGSFLTFRLLYYQDIYPNTYYVKGGPGLLNFIWAITVAGKNMTKLQGFLGDVLGGEVWFLLLVVPIAYVVLCLSKEKHWPLCLAVAVTASVGIFNYIILRQDWMSEYRFATSFFPFIFIVLTVFGYYALKHTLSSGTARTITGAVLALAVIALAAREQYPRLRQFYRGPTVQFEGIASKFGYKFNKYADVLSIENGSFLVPDVGGTLYYSRLKIYDLAGLCDRTIARTIGKDQETFYNYIFDSIQPTFIHTHGAYTAAAKLEDDPRFERDYTYIEQYEDKWVLEVHKAERHSGDFIRRSAIIGKEQLLDSLRQGLLR